MTRSAVLVLALAHGACGTGVAPARLPREAAAARAAVRADAVSPLSFLTDEFERVFPGRVRLARHGPVRLSATDVEPALALSPDEVAVDTGPNSPALVVVNRIAGRIRVVIQEDEYRLLLWIDAADLQLVVSETTDLAIEPGESTAGPPAPGVRAFPGLVVARLEERGDQVKVRHEDMCVAVTGWVPAGRLGREFVPIEPPAPAQRDVSAAVGRALLERPDGRELARFSADCQLASAGRTEAGHTLATYSGDGFEVRGWLSAASVGGGGSRAFGWGHGRFGWPEGDRVLLPAGSCLFAGRGGPVVGVVVDDAEEAASGPAESGWREVKVPTSWGALPLWVAEVEGKAAPSEEAEPDPVGLFSPGKMTRLSLRSCR